MFNFKEFLNEISFNVIPTEYNINIINESGRKLDRYTFISNNDSKYSVYFMLTIEEDIKLSTSNYLSDYTDLNKIPTIFFSLTDRDFGNDFNDLTNRKEFLEVMGKVVFIIRNYIDNHDYTVYTYNSDTNEKENFYNYYRKHFTDFFVENLLSSNYLDSNGNEKNTSFLIKK